MNSTAIGNLNIDNKIIKAITMVTSVQYLDNDIYRTLTLSI